LEIVGLIQREVIPNFKIVFGQMHATGLLTMVSLKYKGIGLD